MAVVIIPVTGNRHTSEFIRLPYRLHCKHPAWVAPLVSEVKTSLDKRKNPFFQHADAELFLARRDGRVVGRIAAIIDRNFIEVRKEQIGLFGFFEAEDDKEAAQALFNKAAEWLKARGITRMLGPASPSMNDEIGVLVDAFDLPPMIKMVWNPSYYPALYEQACFRKAMDLWAWMVKRVAISERMIRAGEAILKRSRATLRNVKMKDFEREVRTVREIYNRAWADNWGFVPWTEEEFKHIAKSLKSVIDPDMVLIAEIDGQPVGFSLALPDLNLALKHINGRLFPFGLPILLWHARKISQVRIPIMGVAKEFRNRGLDTAMYYKTYQTATRKGYDCGEASWILENNEPMNRALTMMGGHRYKTYRMYERDL